MYRLLATLLLSLFSSFAFSFDTIVINQSQINANVVESSDYLLASEDSRSFLQISNPDISRRFTPVHGTKLGYNQFSDTTWLTFAIDNPGRDAIQLFLKIDAPFLDSAELYFNIVDTRSFERSVTGAEVAYRDRPYQVGTFVLPMIIEPGRQQIYLRLDPTTPTDVGIQLMDENTFVSGARIKVQFQTLMAAALIAIVLFSLVDYARFRSTRSLWATLVSSGFALNLSGWSGSIAWLLSSIPWIEVAAINIGAFLSVLGLGLFAVSLKNEPAQEHWLRDAVVWLTRILMIFILLSCLPVTRALLPLQVILIPVSLTVIAVFWFKQYFKSRPERPATLAFVAALLYFFLSTLVLIGMISAFSLLITLFSLLAIIISSIMALTAWRLSSSTSGQVAADSLGIGDVHWPLLRKLNHEIRGPINGVLGMSELLQDTTLSAHQHEYVNTIQTAGFSLLREADQLQNLIRIGLNRLPENEEEFDLYDLLESTLQPFSRIAHNKRLELILDVSPSLPSRYRGNAHIIAQILSNLLDNALKYTEQGEVLVQVKMAANGMIRFAIVDTGPGITKDSRAHIFNFPDSRKSTQQQPKDVHLGLPISKYLTTLLKGQISIKSELRVGSTFQLDLPLAPILTADTKPEPVIGIPFDELRIMVLDDNLTCRKMIEHVALSWGSDVLSMSNPQSAMANLHNQFHKAEPIDVLILDQNMPATTGIELADRIRQDTSLNSDIIIIMMTGVDDLTADFTGSDSGVQYILSKPVSARALKQTIKNAMPVINANRGKNHGKKSYFF